MTEVSDQEMALLKTVPTLWQRINQLTSRAEAAEKEVERLKELKEYLKTDGEKLERERDSCQADCAAQRRKHVAAVAALDEAVSRLKEVLDRQTAPLDEDCFDLGALARLTRLLAEQRAAPQRPAGAALLEELSAAREVVEAARFYAEERNWNVEGYTETGPLALVDEGDKAREALAAYDRAVGEK